MEVLGAVLGHGGVAGGAGSPFPLLFGLDDVQHDGGVLLKVRPWCHGGKKIQKLLRHAERDCGEEGRRGNGGAAERRGRISG